MSIISDKSDTPSRPLRLAVLAAVLGVAGMFTAAATFAGGEAQARDTGSIEAITE